MRTDLKVICKALEVLCNEKISLENAIKKVDSRAGIYGSDEMAEIREFLRSKDLIGHNPKVVVNGKVEHNCDGFVIGIDFSDDIKDFYQDMVTPICKSLIETNLIMSELKGNISIQEFVDLLVEYGFEKTTDENGSYSINSDLYYREINFENYKQLAVHSIYSDQEIYNEDGKRYFVILNHFNVRNKNSDQDFDLQLSVYNNTNEIGKKGFIHNYRIQFSCKDNIKVIGKFFADLKRYQNAKMTI